MSFAYRMVQIPPNVLVRGNVTQGTEAASYLEGVVNQHASEGWEFFRVDPIGVQTQPGCLAGLLGHQATEITYYVITFRKPV